MCAMDLGNQWERLVGIIERNLDLAEKALAKSDLTMGQMTQARMGGQ